MEKYGYNLKEYAKAAKAAGNQKLANYLYRVSKMSEAKQQVVYDMIAAYNSTASNPERCQIDLEALKKEVAKVV